MAFNVGFAEFFYSTATGKDRTTDWPNSGNTTTWTVPGGVYWVWVKAIAGGGGGGNSDKYFATTQGGGGGGAGESVEGIIIQVTPKGTLSIYVGGGGPGGTKGVSATNVHAGPEGSTASGAGFGGEDTRVGPIQLKGGYGGLTGPSGNGHGGMGGGSMAGPKGFNDGAGTTNNADSIGGTSAAGHHVTKKDCGRYWAGSGGGAAASSPANSSGLGIGGPQGPFLGGVEGTKNATVCGGAGGGASVFGNGGNGGNADANGPAVTSTHYGCGGGGAGGNSTTYGGPTINAFNGAAGCDGYVSLHYFIGDNTYTLQAGAGNYAMTGVDATLTKAP